MEETKQREENKEFRRRDNNRNTGMHDPRSESRMKFMQPSLIDPRNKLKQLPDKAAKERRQKIISENREKRINEENNEEKGKIENSEGKRKTESKVYKELVGMIKQVADALRQFEELTKKEIENISSIVNWRYESIEKEIENIYKASRYIDENLKEVKDINNKRLKNNTLEVAKPTSQMQHLKEIKRNIHYIHNECKYKTD